MKVEYRILGLSADTFAVITDVLADCFGKNHFIVHLNKDFGIVPFTPVQPINYEIQLIEKTSVTKEIAYVFGASGPNNKFSIFNDFQEFNGIEKKDYGIVVHPNVYVAKSCNLNTGVFVEPNVVISSQSNVEFGVSIKRGSLIGHHNQIGEFTDINPGVVLSGKVTIGAGCIIGSGVVVKDNISIGKNTVIGIGSVVTKDIPEGVIAYGNPCKVIKENEMRII